MFISFFPYIWLDFGLIFVFQDFVENKLEFEENEVKPAKHNKTFYPPLIEIQNIIQQTQTAMNSGILAPLPTVRF